jgi:hypothetical protein
MCSAATAANEMRLYSNKQYNDCEPISELYQQVQQTYLVMEQQTERFTLPDQTEQ